MLLCNTRRGCLRAVGVAGAVMPQLLQGASRVAATWPRCVRIALGARRARAVGRASCCPSSPLLSFLLLFLLPLLPAMSPFVLAVGVFLWVVAVAGVILFFGDADSPTPLGRAARLVGTTLPHGVWRVLEATRLTWLVRAPYYAVQWFMYKRHPIIQVAYVLLVVGCYAVFVIEGYPLLPNRYMAAYHKAVGVAVFAACCVTFLLASFTDPGVITAANAAHMAAAYPYDHFMYSPRACDTCKTPRVARSKHSRVTDRCVARFDHYCIWLANDVGANNYRWFMAFLLCNTTLLLYGAAACTAILAEEIVAKELLTASFINQTTGERLTASWGIIFQYLMFHFSSIMMVLFIAAVMGIVMVGFTGYHIAMMAANVTTNETFKWKEARWARSQAVADAKAAGSKEPVAPIPASAYDKGVLANVAEVIWPPPLQRQPTPPPAPAPAPAAAAAGGKRKHA